MEELILVRVIDGMEDWIPVKAICKYDEVYEILEDENYLNSDDSVLFEFYPGDIIVANCDIFPTADYDQAIKLLKPSERENRKYLEFKFLATSGRLQISLETLNHYSEEIEKIKQEMSQGKCFYSGIIELIKYLDKALERGG